jgi:hypothetical protein
LGDNSDLDGLMDLLKSLQDFDGPAPFGVKGMVSLLVRKYEN